MDRSGTDQVVESREWVLAAYATRGIPTSDHLKLHISMLSLSNDFIPQNHVALKILWLSVDPYLRTRMSGSQEGLYLPPFELNKAVTGFGLAKVVRSNDSNYEEGENVLMPFCPVAEYCVVPVDQILQKIDPEAGVAFPEYLSTLGVPGFAAWIGIQVIGNAKAGENVFISAAAGGVGMFAGQLAKIKGCRVIGSTGSDDKIVISQRLSAIQILQKIDPEAGVAFPEYLSTLAWIGIQVIGNTKAGENVFISAAAGGVGMFAGQLAKIKGCRVIGSTGSNDKVKLLKENFGYDDAFNYNKETDFNDALNKYFPNGIDVYLDNVGGKMLEAVLNHVNTRARIPLCGMISQYNQPSSEREGVCNLLNMVGKEVRMEGFMVGSSHVNRFGEFAKEMEEYMKKGMINSKHKIYYGIESFLESLGSMFSSSNIGKVVIQVNKDD